MLTSHIKSNRIRQGGGNVPRLLESHNMELNWPENSKSEISAKVIRDGITIRHAGTGCYDGDYDPIVIEWYDGVPRIIIWGDINDQDPTHIIDMSKALESARK